MNTSKTPFEVTVKVLNENIVKFEKFLNKLQAIGTKLNLPKVEYSKLYTITEYLNRTKNNKPIIIEKNYTIYSVKGSDPIINDFQFIGTLSFERGKPFPVVKEVPGQSIPSGYFKTDCSCNHCESKRFRKAVYILLNDKTGEFKQVGSSCLKDFIGHGPVEELLQYYAKFSDFSMFGNQDPDEVSGRGFTFMDVRLQKDDTLGHLIKLIDKYGFVSKKKAMEFDKISTAQLYDWLLSTHQGFNNVKKEDISSLAKEQLNLIFNSEYSEEQISRIEDIKVKVLTLNDQENSFNHNCKNLMQSDYWTYKDLSFVAAMVAIFGSKKEEEKEPKEVKISSWLGYEGDRVTVKNVKIESTRLFTGEWGNSWMHNGIDESGNKVMFYNKNKLVDNDGDIIPSIVGTIKDKKTFKDVKQTVLTRVKVK